MKFIASSVLALVVALPCTLAKDDQAFFRDLKKSDDEKRSRSICGGCEFDAFYEYREVRNGGLRDPFKNPPGQCVLAAIRDDDSRRGAQYAIPEGKIALTQGFIPVDDYVERCNKEDDDTLDGEVVSCHDRKGNPRDYRTLFVNYEGTKVPSDAHIWDHDEFPIDDGLLNVALGADGILRPVKSWQTDSAENKNGFDGAVYECCPGQNRICNRLPPVTTV